MKRTLPGVCALIVLGLAGCARTEAPKKEAATVEWPSLPGYQEMVIPEDNPMTPAKVNLGKQLFYDRRLSGDESRSCYDCHLKEKGLTDGLPTAIGAYGRKLPRSSPTLWNIGYHKEFYWDGRSPSLEKQAMAAWTGGNMGVDGKEGRPSAADIAAKIDAIPGYNKQFREVFGGPATPENMMMAISAFERTIVANDSAWIRFINGDQSALSEQARRGWTIFSEKAKCTNCHDGRLLTDLQYHNVGIGMDKKEPDLGRYNVTKEDKDRGAFKTPTLLDISKSAPYFHDGSVATLEEAVDIMAGGGKKNPWLDTVNLQPVKLTPQEKEDLLAFLRSLDVNFNIEEPVLP